MAIAPLKQLDLLEYGPEFPSTRFQGSKLKLLDWIWDSIKDFQFHTALDAFGGTGCVAYILKTKGKTVTYNDILKFNWCIGSALIENDHIKLSDEDVHFLLTEHSHIDYPTFIYDTFKDIYFTDEENKWLDMMVTNISLLDDPYKKTLAYFALFQSCIIKRPFNLFHRKNLYLRFAKVQRSFGNKTTWDKPFEEHFLAFVDEANRSIFSNGMENRALNSDVFDLEPDYDLVYIDTPYISHKGVGVDYHHFYHFLEGLVDYSAWETKIDFKSKHRKLLRKKSVWTDKNEIIQAFEKLIYKFRNSILVISYRTDGIPSIDELADMLKKYKKDVLKIMRKNYKYVLSNNKTQEVLLIGK